MAAQEGTSVSVRKLTLNFGIGRGAEDAQPRHRRRRIPRAARAVRLRQVDLAELHRRPARHHRRPDLHQGQERHLGGAEGPRHRHGVPVLRALSADDGGEEPLLRPAGRRHAEGRDRRAHRSAPRRSCRSSRCCSASRRRSPAASASASPSAARWCATSTCSCSTSRCPTSTPSCARNCASRSSGCTSGSTTP